MAKILIVDDERSIRETLGEFAREIGHEVFIASEAEEALGIVARSLPDVIVSDIVLPRVDGMALLERAHRIAPDAQVIMITGEPTVDTAANAVRQGAFDYLSKPVSRDEIQSSIESALRVKWLADDRRRLAEENARYRDHLEEEVERKARELSAHREEYKTLVENANEAVFVAQEGMLRFANPKTRSLTGYTEEQLLSMPFPELIHPEDRQMVIERVERRLAGIDEPSTYEFRILDGDGETKWVEIRPVLIDWVGRPATLNLATDVTERRRAAEALVESESRYRTLFEDSPISLWHEDFSGVKARLEDLRAEGVTDLAGHIEGQPALIDECIDRIRVVDVNEATLEMHGASTKAELLASLGGVLTDRSRRDFADQIVAIWEGRPSFSGTTVDRTLDGEEKHVVVQWSVPAGHEETYDRVFVSKSDITATVLAERAFREALDGTIEAIGLTTEMRDPYTAGHQRRVAALAVAIAHELELEETVVEGIRAAGLMHDIGKMAVPAEILSKPSELNEVEMSLMRSHSQVAYDIIRRATFPWPLETIVLQHHERIDGSGYPHGIAGDEICLEARILAVADTVEAMASHRPYRPALGIEKALEEIETGKGTRFDPNAVDACLRLFRDESFTFPTAEQSL